MFLSHILPIDIQYSSLNFITVNKKYNLWTGSIITIVYIMTECVVSIKVMLMMDYISISLAVIVSLVMWWSFLAISGLKGSCPNRLAADSSSQKK
jgi:cobalamin biosynthesis protein CobD/CbiB